MNIFRQSSFVPNTFGRVLGKGEGGQPRSYQLIKLSGLTGYTTQRAAMYAGFRICAWPIKNFPSADLCAQFAIHNLDNKERDPEMHIRATGDNMVSSYHCLKDASPYGNRMAAFFRQNRLRQFTLIWDYITLQGYAEKRAGVRDLYTARRVYTEKEN